MINGNDMSIYNFYRLKTNDTVNDKQEIVLNKECTCVEYWSVRNKEVKLV